MASSWFCSRVLAEQYAKLRPDYPSKLHEQIWEYCGIHPGCRQSLAVDLVCGTGISTRPLAEHFDRVIGIDLSQAQIDNAKTDLPNIQFRVGPGEDLSFLTNESVDLITTANGLHWLNTEHVFAEIKRVLASWCFCGIRLLTSAQVYCVAIFLVSQEVSLNFHHCCG